MLTVFLLMVTLAVIYAAGEFVRGQCRRMLSRPVAVTADRQRQ